MGITKNELLDRYGIGRKALDDTLKRLGISHTKGIYSDEEVSEWIDPAREMVKNGKTLAEVEAWANEKRNGSNGNGRGAARQSETSGPNIADVLADGTERVMQDFVDVAIYKALAKEMKNPMQSVQRVVSRLSPEQVRGMINSDDYQADLARLLEGDRSTTAFDGRVPRHLLEEAEVEEDGDDEGDGDLSEWDKPIDVPASDASDGEQNEGGNY
jgi:hypothetical protein